MHYVADFIRRRQFYHNLVLKTALEKDAFLIDILSSPYNLMLVFLHFQSLYCRYICSFIRQCYQKCISSIELLQTLKDWWTNLFLLAKPRAAETT